MIALRVAPLERLDGAAPGETRVNEVRINVALLASIRDALRQGYGIEVEPAAALGEPGFAWDHERGQYNAPLILRRLLELSADGSARLLAVTGLDLYIPMLSFVYGQAQLGGKVAVVSMARLRPEYYGLPPDEELLQIRARKEALHEVGHLLGLVHCPDVSCAMALSTGIRQLDRKQPSLCTGCAALASEGRNVLASGRFEGRR